MNGVDLLLIVVVLLAAWAGWTKGFILGLTDLAIWIGGLLGAFFFYQYVGRALQALIPALGVWHLPLAFLITLLLSRWLLATLLYRLVNRTRPETHRTTANKALGILPGLVNGGIYAAVTAALLLSLPLSNGITRTAQESRIASKLGSQVAWLDEKFSPIFGPAAKETMNRVMVKPESDETVALNFKTTSVEARPDLEAEMLVLVNKERTERGLQPLKADPQFVPVARAHSTDMFARGYFSHYTPERKDPFDRMRRAGIKFLTAGENLALGRSLIICHEGLMNSPGHRANILNPRYGRLGIGIMDGGIYGLMISQEFRN